MRKLKLINGEEKLLNVKEAAYKLGVSEKAIRTWQYQGKLPYVKLFGSIRFRRNTLDQLIDQQTITGGNKYE